MNDRSSAAVVGFIVGAVIVASWLGGKISDKDDAIRNLKRSVAQAKTQGEKELREERERSRAFRFLVVDIAEADVRRMADHAQSAAALSLILSEGCGPGYTNPQCDGWYDYFDHSKAYAWRRLAVFSLTREVREELANYDKELLRRVRAHLAEAEA